MVSLIPLVLVTVLTQADAGHSHPPAADAQAHARHGVHGMVLMGRSDAAFISHIPMYRRPHDVQLIAEVRLKHSAWSQPRDFSQELHTLVPERFDLTALLEGKLKSFRGAVHRGNFEADGPLLQDGVQVEVVRVLRAEVLPSSSPIPRLYVFGNERDSFAVHVIREAPSFDQVLVVSVSGAIRARLPAGVEVPLRPDERLRPGQVLADKVTRVEVVRELSYLVGPEFVPPAPVK